VNDRAEQRGIVVHGADYVSDQIVQQQGYVGRSWGCPALPAALTEPVINTIRDGSAFFIYHPNERYHQNSALLKTAAAAQL
jgi:hypothetical protein